MVYENTKNAVVTGAAGTIGKAITERLALHCKYNVCALDLNAEAVQAVVRGIVDRGGRAHAYVVDLCDDESLKLICDEVVAQHGDIDILINNAGFGSIFPVEDYPEENWHKTLALNLTAPFRLSIKCISGMRKRSWGRIINISSINGLRAGTGRLAYGTSKTAIIGLTRQLAVDTAQWGITVNAVAPGAIMSPMLDAMTTMGNGSKDALISYIPMGRFGLPEEVAGAVAFLASDDAAYITGQTLVVDGGFAAGGILAKR